MSDPELNSFHILEARREDFETIGVLRRLAFATVRNKCELSQRRSDD
jgi:hypothetical protein